MKPARVSKWRRRFNRALIRNADGVSNSRNRISDGVSEHRSGGHQDPSKFRIAAWAGTKTRPYLVLQIGIFLNS